jgi:hypothetical protein
MTLPQVTRARNPKITPAIRTQLLTLLRRLPVGEVHERTGYSYETLIRLAKNGL